MTTIGYQSIEDVLLSLVDPNTGGTVGEVPGVSSPKINAGVSIYNENAGGGSGTGIAGWSTNITWAATDYNTVSWSSGYIYLPDGTNLSVSSGNTGDMSGMTYIYYDRDLSSVQTTSSAQTSVGENKILLCVAAPVVSGKEAEFQAFGTNGQSTFITADNIAANTITGNEIAANTITANEMNVSQLSAISANLGTINAGTITGTTITAGNTSNIAVKLDPTSTNGRIEFYEGGNQIGTMAAGTITQGNAVVITSNYIGVGGSLICINKLKIPVGTDLYD